MRYMIIALAAVVLPTAAFAKEQGTHAQPAQTATAMATTQEASASTLMPGRLDLPVVEGSRVPSDCHFPQSLQTAGHYDLGCVVMPGAGTEEVGAQYLGMLGQRGWRQGELISGGFSAVHAEANGCQRVMGIYPSEYPPRPDAAPAAAPQRDPEEFGDEDGDDDSTSASDTVLWFALDRNEHCAQAR